MNPIAQYACAVRNQQRLIELAQNTGEPFAVHLARYASDVEEKWRKRAVWERELAPRAARERLPYREG